MLGSIEFRGESTVPLRRQRSPLRRQILRLPQKLFEAGVDGMAADLVQPPAMIAVVAFEAMNKGVKIIGVGLAFVALDELMRFKQAAPGDLSRSGEKTPVEAGHRGSFRQQLGR